MNPAFLSMLPLVALPVIFHLVMKRERETRVFSSFMFFHQIDPKMRSRRQIKEWLLLLARALLILFILLALCRPVIRSVTLSASHVAVVVVLDNSGSMAARTRSGRTKMEAAVEGARTLLKSLDDDAEAAIELVVDDPAFPRRESLTSNVQDLLRSLAQVKATEATGSAGVALHRAAEKLSHLQSGGAIHVFSDAQAAEWTAEPVPEDTLPWHVDVVVHRIATDSAPGPNVTVNDIVLPEERLLQNRPYTFLVSLANSGTEALDVQLNTVDDAGSSNVYATLVPAGAANHIVPITVRADDAGFHWVNVRVDGDGFTADNRAGAGFMCEQRARVALAGTAADFGALTYAISPWGDGRFTSLVPELVEPGKLESYLAVSAPVLVVVPWDVLFARATAESSWGRTLREFVQGGGAMLLVPALTRRTDPGTAPDWVGAVLQERQMHVEASAALTVTGARHELWRDMRDDAGRIALENIDATICHHLELAPEYEPLLQAEQGTAVLAGRRSGTGHIYVSGLAVDRSWTNLPLSPGSMVMIQTMATSGSAGPQRQLYFLRAGERLVALPTAAEEVEIVSLIGNPMNWRGQLRYAPDFPWAGVYTVKAGQERFLVSVRASALEADNEFVTGEKIPIFGAREHRVSELENPDQLQRELEAGRAGLELFVPFLVLAVLAMAAEGWLANPPPRKEAG